MTLSRRSLIVAAILLLAAGGFTGYEFHQTLNTLEAAQESLASTTAALAARTAERDSLAASSTELSSVLTTEKQKSETYQAKIADISDTVDTLTKLTQTDPELLKKYSKVYFLNENYKPATLAEIDPEYVYDSTRTLEFQQDALPFLTKLMDAAAEDDVPLKLVSSYRSFGTQAALKTSYKVTYGSGANAFSADQGYSEHQLGTTVDFTTPKLGVGYVSFASTDAYEWLTKHAYRYGFILSYPKSNKYYQYEPWHWRFVGVALATKLHEDGQNFYDLDQREIDSYLIKLFDR